MSDKNRDGNNDAMKDPDIDFSLDDAFTNLSAPSVDSDDDDDDLIVEPDIDAMPIPGEGGFGGTVEDQFGEIHGDGDDDLDQGDEERQDDDEGDDYVISGEGDDDFETDGDSADSDDADGEDNDGDFEEEEGEAKPGSKGPFVKRVLTAAASVAAICVAAWGAWVYAGPMLGFGKHGQTAAPQADNAIPQPPADLASKPQAAATPALPPLPSAKPKDIDAAPADGGQPVAVTLPAQITPPAVAEADTPETLAPVMPAAPAADVPAQLPAVIGLDQKPASGSLQSIESGMTEVLAQLKEISSRIEKLEDGSVSKAEVLQKFESMEQKIGELSRRISDNEAAVADIRSGKAPALAAKPAKPAPKPSAPAADPVLAPAVKKPAASQTASAEKPVRKKRSANVAPPAKPEVLSGYALKGWSRGMALIETQGDVVEVSAGSTLPGGIRVTSVTNVGGDWVVVTNRGVIVRQ